MTHSERRAQLWADAAVACISSSNCTKIDIPVHWADATLAAFDKRFVEAIESVKRQPVRVPELRRVR